MTPEEYMARMKMKDKPQEKESIVDIAEPVTEESFLAGAPNYQRDLSFIQQPEPEPGPLQQVGSYVADSALNKSLNAGMDKGTGMLKNWWGGLGSSAAGAGGGSALGGASPLLTGLGGGAAGAGAAGAGAAGAGAGAAGATAGGAGMMAGLGALGPIGLGLGGIMLAKKFGLFNQGGSVGPLSPQYKERGDEIETPKSKPRYLMYPYQSNVEAPMPRPRPMTYGEAYDKTYGKHGFEHSEPENKLGKSLYHGFNKAFSPTIALDAKVMQWMYNKEMRDAGVPGFNQGGDVQYKEHGGMMAGPLSNNKSVKMETKETIEYKN